MTDQTAPHHQTASRERPASGWAIGFTLFAAIMMLMTGMFHALAGLVAIFENEFYVSTRDYLFQFDATSWGWIHLLRLLVAFAGWGYCQSETEAGWSRSPWRPQASTNFRPAHYPYGR